MADAAATAYATEQLSVATDPSLATMADDEMAANASEHGSQVIPVGSTDPPGPSTCILPAWMTHSGVKM